jgi:hypothetical protein
MITLEHTEGVTEGKECKRAAVPEGENLCKERRWELEAEELKAEQSFAAFTEKGDGAYYFRQLRSID